jgi:hypothetical protein
VLKVRSLTATVGFLLVFSGAAAAQALHKNSEPEQRGQREWGGWDWSDRGKQERLDFLAKVLNWRMNAPDPLPENVFLNARAGELLERAKQARGNNFQFDRLASATDNLLRASERISSARKASQVDENEKRDAAILLQKCYFRVQQAGYFADLSAEKETKQYETYTRGIYQQARSAYDARQYDRAQMLGEASSLIVMALENIAHASLKIPDPPVIK